MVTFNEAFKAARKAKGAGATFTWNGKKYTTDYKEEKGAAKPKGAAMASSKVPNTRTKNETMEGVRRNARAIVDTTSPARSTKGKVTEETKRATKRAKEPVASAIYDKAYGKNKWKTK